MSSTFAPTESSIERRTAGNNVWLRRAGVDERAELMAHATQRKYEYRHQWQYGDMVLWDNRSVMHKANPDYDMNERRFLYRLMLKGEPPIPVAQAA